MKIVIACDSFKGSLDSSRVNEACRKGVADVRPDAVVDSVILADGGEGTVNAVAASAGHGTWHSVDVSGPLGTNVTASYYALPDRRTAIIETASAAGITLIGKNELNPLLTSTFGLGQLIADAVGRGYKKIVIGLGGSATNDGGTGMLQALGFRLFDHEGRLIENSGGRILADIARVDSSRKIDGLDNVKFTALCDVTNPLTGPQGATYVFGPQKGADSATLSALERGMCNFARLIGPDVASRPGAGAAGGLGAALMAFLHATLAPGAETLLELVDFEEKLNGADLVITGEGRVDKSTLMGKGPGVVAAKARAKGIPVVAIGGSVDAAADLSIFDRVMCVNPPGLPEAEAMKPEIAAANIRGTVARIVTLHTNLPDSQNIGV